MKLSKNKIKFKVNEREYRLKKWSTITTLLEGKKLVLAIGPSVTTVLDIQLNSKKEDTLESLIEEDGTDFLLTTAVTALQTNLTDDHFISVFDKLLSGLEYRCRDEDGELGDFVKVGEEWSEHFDNYQEDFDIVTKESFKANLYDFFMKQATVRSSIEKMLTVVKPLTDQLKNNTKEDTNLKS